MNSNVNPSVRPLRPQPLAAHSPLPTAHRLLPAAYCPLPTACCLLPTACCLLPTAHCLLPTACCLLACIAAALPPAWGADDLDKLEGRAFRVAVERVAPSVVSIETVGGLERVGRVLLESAPTTGLVVGSDGYVVSSSLPLLNQPDSILVRLPDGTRKPAQLVATDHSRMIVLLKIETDEPLAVPEVVPEAEIRVGQWAIAVGRTFDADRTNMSVGIVSALNRVWGKAIQTDAAVSPNNYGGPLVDVRGRVLGVLVPLSAEGDNEIAGVQWYDSGIGFAVAASHILKILPKLKQGRDLHRGVIGISFPAGNPSTAEPVIAACHPNSPAREAGLKPADRIVEIDGRRIVHTSQVKEELGRRYAGDTLGMVVLRDDQRIETELKLVAKLEPYERPFLGILPMRAAAARDDRSAGVVVRYVYPEGPAARAGIEPGDVLVSLGGEPIDDHDQLRRRISDRRPDEEVELAIRRGQDRETVRLKVQLGRLPEDLPPDVLPPARLLGRSGTGVTPVPPGEGKAAADVPLAGRPQAGSIQLKIPEFENDAWAYVPRHYDPAVRYGLVVWLHAPGELNWEDLLARWKPHCDRSDLILLAPLPSAGHGNAPPNGRASPAGWQVGEKTLVRKLIDEVNSSYTVDPSRIVVHGQQEGGCLAYVVAFESRDLVRAVATVDAPVTSPPPENDPVYCLAFYVAWAEKSRHADRIEAAVTRLRQMKYPVTAKDLGEAPRDLDGEETSELVRWIDTLDRI